MSNASFSNILDSQWHHIALTYSASNQLARLYLDGDLEAEKLVQGQPGDNVSEFRIGDKGWANELEGTVDEIRLYSRALTFEEIILLPNTYADPDGDGLSNLGEFNSGSDPLISDTDGDGILDGADTQPTDYYNGVLPVLNIVGGNFQRGPANTWLPEPLVIQVTNPQGQPLSNAPVDFVIQAGGFLAASPQDQPVESLALRTDTLGHASAFFLLPPLDAQTSLIHVSALSNGQSVQTSFSAETFDTAATPEFSPNGGEFNQPQNVVITSATEGTLIHYTTDGSNPDQTSPAIVSGETVRVDTSLTLKARAFKEGWNPSEVASAEFTINALPLWTDNDGDGLIDGWEIKYGLDPTVNDAGLDPDGDGLTNLQEFLNFTNPFSVDSDNDGINDDVEVLTGSQASIDTDEDGLPDDLEELLGSDPNQSDSDGDGQSDYAGYFVDDQLVSFNFPKGDTRSLPQVRLFISGGDQADIDYALSSSTIQIASVLFTGNQILMVGYTDFGEYIAGVGPPIAGGQIQSLFEGPLSMFLLNGERLGPDGELIGSHGEQLGPAYLLPLRFDLDVDSDNNNGLGLPNRSRVENLIENDPAGTGKFIASNTGDADGDGVPDFADGLDLFGNEGDNASAPFVPMVLEIPKFVDPGSSQLLFSYRPSNPNDIVKWVNEDESISYFAPEGLRIWTKNGDQNRRIADVTAPVPGDFVPAHFVSPSALGLSASNRQVVLYVEAVGPFLYSESFPDPTIEVWFQGPGISGLQDKVKFTPVKVGLLVDANRDGEMDIYFNTDHTTPSKPFRFWCNEDVDRVSVFDPGEQDDDDPAKHPNDKDDQLDHMICTRNLEDFARLWLSIKGVAEQVKSGEIQVGLEWRNAEGSPSIRIYRAVESDGGTKYLTDQATAQAQVDGLLTSYPIQYQLRTTIDTQYGTFILPKELFGSLSEASPTTHLLFEASGKGKGQLVVVLRKAGQQQNDPPLAESAPIFFDLMDISDMYDHYTTGDTDEQGYLVLPGAEQIGSVKYTPEKDDYILFCHGWRMQPWERRAFAETSFKRLYWQGYKGYFGLFSYPTEWNAGTWEAALWDPQHFDRSELQAWKSAAGLNVVLHKLNSKDNGKHSGKVRVFAHSQANFIIGEALHLEADSAVPQVLVHTYVATQAATPGSFYRAGLETVTFLPGLGPTTPEVYENYPLSGQPYFKAIRTVASNVVNFFNTDDRPTGDLIWGNNEQLKPDINYHYGNLAEYTTPQFYYQEADSRNYRALLFPVDRYEIYSHAAEPRSRSLAHQSDIVGEGSPGPFNGQFDLETAFQFGNGSTGHSAQFRSSNMNRNGYWDRLLKTFKLKAEE